MKSKIAGVLVVGCLFATSVFGDPNTQIRYQTTNLGSGRWQYTYEVDNLNLSVPIEEFTIWFSIGSYGNLAIATQNPPASNWDEIVVQQEPVLKDDGFYDSLALGAGIAIGQTVPDFSVSFDWLGIGMPGSQLYEIIDPLDFHTIESGHTVPEPATLLLFGLGGVILRRKRISHEDAKAQR
jgi:hypothetical protein